MSWRCSGLTNAALISNLVEASLLTTPRVITAFRQVDRADFLSPLIGGNAYEDAPQYIDYGATISAPHMHAMCTETLAPSLVEGAKVLDIGSGSGFLLSVFARLVGASGSVTGIEHVPELVVRANAVLDRTLPKNLRDVVTNTAGDGRSGITPNSFDAIHVGAAALRKHLPLYIKALRSGGLLVIPVNQPDGNQELILVKKPSDGSVPYEKAVCGVRYVPLTDLEMQIGGGVI